MSQPTHGPRLTDEELFTQCLNLETPGLEAVRAAAETKDWPAARRALAAFLRALTVPEAFFDLPYEPPENVVMTPGETEAEACRRVKRHTLISVGVPCEFGEGQTVDWTANPTPNGYREWPYQLNRHHELKMLAHQYRLTGDETLAQCAAELLASWLKQALVPDPETPGNKTLCWRTIECGIRAGCTWPYAFSVFHSAPAFGDDLLVDWLKSCVEHARRLSRNHMSGNWLVMEMNGLAHISLLLPFLSGAVAWREQSFASLTEQLECQIYPDGFQYELTTNYHNVIIINYQRLLNLCGALSYPVPDALRERLFPAIGLEAKLMMPDGTTPDLNDGHRFDVAHLMRLRRPIFPAHPAVRYLADGDAAFMPKETSVILPYAGFAVLRTGWSSDAAWALLDGAPFGRAHQHEDKLNVLFYALGKLLLTEGGNYAYDVSPMRAYVLDTASHNTVRVDGLPQNRRENYRWQPEMIRQKAGLTWHLGTQWDFAAAVYDEGYGPNRAVQARHERHVYFRRQGEPLLMVVDRVSAADDHVFEWLWHVDSALEALNGRCASFAEVDVTFSTGCARVITGQEAPEWQGFVATGTEQGMYRPVPCLSVQARGREARMVTVFAPHAPGGKRLTAVEADTGLESDALRLLWHDGTIQTLLESEMQTM